METRKASYPTCARSGCEGQRAVAMIRSASGIRRRCAACVVREVDGGWSFAANILPLDDSTEITRLRQVEAEVARLRDIVHSCAPDVVAVIRSERDRLFAERDRIQAEAKAERLRAGLVIGKMRAALEHLSEQDTRGCACWAEADEALKEIDHG